MKVVRFRVLLDVEEDVYRDIEVTEKTTFEELYSSIIGAFGFSGEEMASFYCVDDDWQRGTEIPLMDVGELSEQQKTMREICISDLVNTKNDKFLLVYDFLKMWVFYLNIVLITDADELKNYPNVSEVFGNAPDENSKAIDLPIPERQASEDSETYEPENDDFDDAE